MARTLEVTPFERPVAKPDLPEKFFFYLYDLENVTSILLKKTVLPLPIILRKQTFCQVRVLKIENQFFFSAPYKPYTDDTAMTKCIAESLIEKKGFDGVDLAKRFVREYFQDPRRGYGANVTSVFHKLKGSKFADPFGPAREQFDGLGSLGNGAAMRIAPVALFCYNNLDNLIDVAKKSSEITHTHKLGVNGAILQTLAIRKCLLLDPKDVLNVNKYTDELIEEMVEIEKDQDDLNPDPNYTYRSQLGVMKDLLNKDHPNDEEVVNKLGHSVAALYSVPTAVFSFLKAQTEIPEIETDNPFRRTLQYAISLGGDTDTIASMAGAIAGAYYGYDIIGESLQKHCEGTDKIIQLADNLYELSSS